MKMQNKTLLALVMAALLPTPSFANLHPVISVATGSDHANVYSTKTITLIAPFQNSYIGTSHYDSESMIGLFLGVEQSFLQNWAWQLGLGYYQSSAFQANGNVYQFSDPAFNNLTYQYQIQSKRVVVEGKIYYTCHSIWHPYVTAAVGEAINKTYGYSETPVTSMDVGMGQPFAGQTAHAFTYTVGLGADVDISEHLRFGGGYRFINLGSASLGPTPLQSGTNTISNKQIHANEFLVQLSYVG